jgi:type II secretory pathway pseudopilin PulG
MEMKRGVESSVKLAGFTIVETMIVLAVTGMLFIAIASTWFGRQHRTEFQTSAQEARSRIQQVISDVQNGYFPNQNNFTCKVNGSGLLLDGGSNEQGTNYPCVFLGKVIQFHFADTEPELYRIYTIAADGSKTDIAASKPRVVAPSTTPPPATGVGFPDNSQSGELNNGLSLRAYKINTSGAVHISDTPASPDVALGFLSTLGQLDANNAYTSGTQRIDSYALPESSLPQNSTGAANAINTSLQDPTPNYATNLPIALCFQSGSTKQYAIITIGANSNQLTADLTIKQGMCDANFN